MSVPPETTRHPASCSPAASAFARVGERLGPDRLYARGLDLLNALSDRIHDVEVRDLRTRVAAVLVPAGLLVALGIWATPTADAYAVGTIGGDDVGLALVVTFAAAAAVATTFPRHHLTLVLVLSSVGFSLAVAYAFFGGPDVAVVAVLVETILALAFLGVFALLPRGVLRREAQVPTSASRRWRDPLVALVSGGAAFVVVWGALSRPAPEESVAAELERRAPDAHAKDVVTAILVKGYSDVGDGFTAGVFAALGVLIQYAALGYRTVEEHLPVRFAVHAALGGLLLALLVAFAPILWGEPPLTHYPRAREPVIHVGTGELLTAVAFDVGVFLLVLGVAVGAVDAFARAADRSRA